MLTWAACSYKLQSQKISNQTLHVPQIVHCTSIHGRWLNLNIYYIAKSENTSKTTRSLTKSRFRVGMAHCVVPQRLPSTKKLCGCSHEPAMHHSCTKIAEVRRYKGLSYSLPDLNQLITPQSQIISHFDFSRFIGFAMHLYINIYGSRKAETTNNLEQGSSKEEF
jgi:hypothetical protein